MNTIGTFLIGVMLFNAAIFTSFLSYQCWEEFRERRAKKQANAKPQLGGEAK